MTFRSFQTTFHQIPSDTPLPGEATCHFQRFSNSSLLNDLAWFEVLHRTAAWSALSQTGTKRLITTSSFNSSVCDEGHEWRSSWSMILFRFHCDFSTSIGRVRTRRFGQSCYKCSDDRKYHIGTCEWKQVLFTAERLLFDILQRCYERRADEAIEYYIIPISNVPNGIASGTAPHRQDLWEACGYDRCQEM